MSKTMEVRTSKARKGARPAPLLLSHLTAIHYRDCDRLGYSFYPVRWSLLPCEGDLRRAIDRAADTIEATMRPLMDRKRPTRLEWTYQETGEVIELHCSEVEGEDGDICCSHWTELLIPASAISLQWVKDWRL